MIRIVKSIFFKVILLSIIFIISGCSKQTDVLSDTMTDIDGNVYKTVKIGDMIWMAENLRVTRYRNGTSIPAYSTAAEWSGDYNGLCTDYEFIEDRAMGRLYNWYAVKSYDNHILAPEGWHIPTEKEWQKLIFYLGGTEKAGSMIKDTLLWQPIYFPNREVSGFNAPPAGYRDYYGVFTERGFQTGFWSSTTDQTYSSFAVFIFDQSDNIQISGMIRAMGFSVRCVKD